MTAISLVLHGLILSWLFLGSSGQLSNLTDLTKQEDFAISFKRRDSLVSLIADLKNNATRILKINIYSYSQPCYANNKYAAFVTAESNSEKASSFHTWLQTFLNKKGPQHGLMIKFRSTRAIKASIRSFKVPDVLYQKMLFTPIILKLDAVDSYSSSNLDIQYIFLKLKASLVTSFYYALGWSIKWYPNSHVIGYSWLDVSSMKAFVELYLGRLPKDRLIISARVIFFNAKTMPQLLWLLNSYPHSRLLVWSASDQEGSISIENVNRALLSVPQERLLLDVPRSLLEKIKVVGTEVPCLRLYNTSDCFDGSIKDFNGKLSPVFLMEGNTVAEVEVEAPLHRCTTISLSGVVDRIGYYKLAQNIRLVAKNLTSISDIFTLVFDKFYRTCMKQLPYGVDVWTELGTNSTTCRPVVFKAFSFSSSMNMITKVMNVTVFSINPTSPGYIFEARPKENRLVVSKSFEFEPKDLQKSVYLVFSTTNSSKTVFHDLEVSCI